MQTKAFKYFSSKILLFGEYGLMYGSGALSIPYKDFHGRLKLGFPSVGKIDASHSNRHLKRYAAFLREQTVLSEMMEIDIKRLENDIASELYFESNIPQGYGLGSSGALVAALVFAYGNPKPGFTQSKPDLIKLKAWFSSLESYFHGKSSGLDPLISYLNKPLLIEGAKSIVSPFLPDFDTAGKGAIFLLDSGTSGETQPLVDFFVNECKSPRFMDLIKNKFIPLTNDCIESYLSADANSLLRHIQLLSDFQFGHFQRMIPASLSGIWKNGLESGHYSLKLCGSGGGGMMLGCTVDFDKCREELSSYPLRVLHHF